MKAKIRNLPKPNNISSGHSLASKIRRHKIHREENTGKADESLPGISLCSYTINKHSRSGQNALYEQISPGAWHLVKKGDRKTSFREYRHK